MYEGYLLYPYRKSSPKNKIRWQFGVLAPAGWVAANIPADQGVSGAIESSVQQTQCLLQSPADAVLRVRVRFLRVVKRQPEMLLPNGCFTPVDLLEDDIEQNVPFEEAAPEEHDLVIPLAEVHHGTVRKQLLLPAWGTSEAVLRRGEQCGQITRRAAALAIAIHVNLTLVEAQQPLFRLCIRIENKVDDFPARGTRPQALLRSLVATHLLLGVSDGAFLSLLDPPSWAAAAARECRNIHAFPVLIGNDRRYSVMLSAPIILYDGVSVAPESPGDLHDGAEIDEILSLRTMTLTEAEKAEARRTDPRAAAIVDRVDNMSPAALARLHGTQRGVDPSASPASRPPRPWWEPRADADIDPEQDTVLIDGVPISRGSHVRLRPRGHGADAYDLFLAGRIATVARVLTDVDGSRFVAVTVGGDPAGGIEEWYGRTFHFRPEEIEPLARSVLVAGIGNIFLGDDGFGVAVISELDSVTLPDEVTTADFGIRGVHLAYELLDGRYDTLVLVDAVPMQEPPGTLAVLRIDGQDADGDQPRQLDAHAMTPHAVLSALHSLGGSMERVFVLGCQPASLEPVMALTTEVAAAVSPAARMVTELVDDLIGRPSGVSSDA
jgi:hydrogenase maturation protease